MRILLVSDLYAPVIGGIEMHVAGLAAELARRDHEVAVVTLGHSSLPSLQREGDVTIHRVDGWTNALQPFYRDGMRRFHPPVPDPGFVRGLARVARSFRPQVVHCNGWSLYSALAGAPRNDAKVVVTLHDFSLVCAKKTFVQRGSVCAGPGPLKCLQCSRETYGLWKGAAISAGLRLSSTMHDRIDACIAASETVASTARAALPAEKIVVIPSFIPTAPADTDGGRPPFLPPDDGYILFVGALGPHKGVDVLLRAYESIRTEIPLVLLGTRRHDSPRSYPEGVAVEHDVPHDAVMAAWAHAGVGVVPSTCPEGFGLVAVEAMASGVPVVASKLGGLAELVTDRETGLLVPPGDAAALARALRELLEDGDLRTALGQGARERAREFTSERTTLQIEALYERVVAET